MDTMTTLERQGGDELLAQLLSELLYLPSPTTTSGDGRRRRRGSNNKRGRRDDDRTNGAEEPAAQPRCSGRTRKTKQQKSKYLVTSEPDFDGYQWRKYGQKQIEGAMYARSYYRCTRSAEQGCPAKRTVQRNDDDGGGAAAKYTVVYMGEHTCTATDSLEAPVILETTAVVPAAASISTNNKRSQDDEDITINNSIAPTTCTSTGGTWIESPAISDITWSSSDHVDDYSGLLPVYDSWALAPASAASLQEMEDFTGPIRSPVHIPADGWTIDQFLMQVDGRLPFLIS